WGVSIVPVPGKSLGGQGSLQRVRPTCPVRSGYLSGNLSGWRLPRFRKYCERPETWVTFRTGHMGDTFRFRAGGVDAVESEFGNGRAPSFRRSAPGWRADDPDVSGVRHLAQDRL